MKRFPILYHLVVMLIVLMVGALAAYLLMALGTRHYAQRTVPNFVGVRVDVATDMAEQNDLQVIVNDSLHVSSYPGGVVLDQLPKGGVVVKPGRKVYITINALRQPMVNVPYVAGRSLRQAKNVLEMSGLTIERLVYVEDIATNYVLAQFINGEEVVEGSEIKAEKGSGVVLNVGVSDAGSVTGVPQLLGRSLAEAKSRLWESGLNVGNVEYDADIDITERNRAKVCWQSAFPSTELVLGQSVSVRLTKDMERVEAALAEYDRVLELQAQEKMRADSVAKAEQHILDSLATLEKPQPQQTTESEDNFFF